MNCENNSNVSLSSSLFPHTAHPNSFLYPLANSAANWTTIEHHHHHYSWSIVYTSSTYSAVPKRSGEYLSCTAFKLHLSSFTRHRNTLHSTPPHDTASSTFAKASRLIELSAATAAAAVKTIGRRSFSYANENQSGSGAHLFFLWKYCSVLMNEHRQTKFMTHRVTDWLTDSRQSLLVKLMMDKHCQADREQQQQLQQQQLKPIQDSSRSSSNRRNDDAKRSMKAVSRQASNSEEEKQWNKTPAGERGFHRKEVKEREEKRRAPINHHHRWW